MFEKIKKINTEKKQSFLKEEIERIEKNLVLGEWQENFYRNKVVTTPSHKSKYEQILANITANNIDASEYYVFLLDELKKMS